VVLRRLAAAPRTRHELAVDLVERGVPQYAIDVVLDRFTEVGLIDDVAFARMWVDSRVRTRGSAPRVLRQELRRRGIDEDLIEEVLADIDTDQQRDTAHRIAVAKLRSLERFDTAVKARRLTGLLMRRGHSPSVAFEVVKTVVTQEYVNSMEA
jgi:regulatory protein